MATDPETNTTVCRDQAQPLEPSVPANPDCGEPQPDASTSTLAANPAAAVVLDKLASLDVARKAERERRREESRAAADPRESIATFLRGFSSRQRLIEDALQRMLLSQRGSEQQPVATNGISTHTAAATGSTDTAAASSDVDRASEDPAPAPLEVSTATPEQVNASLELLGSEVAALERSAATASYYLPPYDQKQCAAAVAAMRAAIEGARSALAPRRRFAFGSKKVSKVRGEEVSTAAATSTASASSSSAAAVQHSTSAGSLGSGAAAPPPAVGPSAPSPAPATGGAAATAAAAPPASVQPGASPSDAAATAASSLSGPSSSPSSSSSLDWVSEQDRALVARGRGLMGLTDATVVLPADRVSERGAGGDFVLLGLTRCRVVLLGRLRALRVAGLRECSVVAGPVTGACFVDDVRDSGLTLATYQVRVHRTTATDLFLRVRSKPIIEHSSGIRVAPWAAAVAPDPRLDGVLQAHMLGEETGCWQQVDDFGWIKTVQSPHWAVMPEEDRPREPQRVPEEVWRQDGGRDGAVVEGAGDGAAANAAGERYGAAAGGDAGADAAAAGALADEDEI